MSFQRPAIGEVKAIALDRLEQILAELVPGGHRAGNCYMAKNPTRHDKQAGSFVIWTGGSARGAFKEFCAGEDEKGDIVDLVSYCLSNGAGFKEKAARVKAIQWLTQFLRLENMGSQARSTVWQAARRREADRASEADTEARKQASAHKTWLEGRPLFDTLGETYLREARGIDIRKIPNLETDVRFLDRQEFWLGRDREKRTPGPSFPAIVSAFRDAAGRFVGMHMTFLAHDGSDKAPVFKPKLIWPTYQGAVIRLTRGESGLTPEEATDKGIAGPVQLYEGIEDGLSGALVAPEIRCWAAGALGNFQNVPALPCVDSFMLHRQNDWTSRAAVTAFEHARAALEATGRPVAEIPTFGAAGDINDMVRDG